AVERDEVAGREQAEDAGRVGRRRRRGHVGLLVALRGPGRPEAPLPELAAVFRVEAEHVKPVLLDARRRGDEDAPGGDHGRRQADARQVGGPRDALLLRPLEREVGLGGDAHAGGPAELGPVIQCQDENKGGDHLGISGVTLVNGTAPPRASQSRAWKPHDWAQSSFCSFWQTLISTSFGPFRSLPRPTYWSIVMPWWYSWRKKRSSPLRKSLTALLEATRSSTGRSAGESTTA